MLNTGEIVFLIFVARLLREQFCKTYIIDNQQDIGE